MNRVLRSRNRLRILRLVRVRTRARWLRWLTTAVAARNRIFRIVRGATGVRFGVFVFSHFRTLNRKCDVRNGYWRRPLPRPIQVGAAVVASHDECRCAAPLPAD